LYEQEEDIDDGQGKAGPSKPTAKIKMMELEQMVPMLLLTKQLA
jgi:hypothetical protein